MEAVFIGIQTPRTEPGARVPNRNYWSYVPGREGVGAEDNISLFHDIRGMADVDGVPVEIDVGGDFAFFMYPRSATDDTAYAASAAHGGSFSVLATTDNGAEFIGYTQIRAMAPRGAHRTAALQFALQPVRHLVRRRIQRQVPENGVHARKHRHRGWQDASTGQDLQIALTTPWS